MSLKQNLGKKDFGLGELLQMAALQKRPSWSRMPSTHWLLSKCDSLVESAPGWIAARMLNQFSYTLSNRRTHVKLNTAQKAHPALA